MDDLQHLKRLSGLSNQQIADLSDVPLATVQRIMSGSCKNPGYDNVSAIQDALLQHVQEHDFSPRFEGLATSEDIERINAQYRETLEHIEAQFTASLASKDEQFAAALASKDAQFEKERAAHAGRMKVKERWLVRLGIACSILVGFIMTVLIIDMANPNIGWIRSAYLKDTISNVWGEVAATFYMIFGV